ncbi:MAG TPA: antitoxin VapB family protein [Candidatus Nanoarchaeia archaeon]|nr:antitoxin VapB family protein [Candidatus Nanoarchaeia archaeon]
MISRTIKISEESYRWLLSIATELQKRRGELASFDDAIKEMKGKKKKRSNIMKFAGAWKMSDKEANNFINETYKERSIRSHRL